MQTREPTGERPAAPGNDGALDQEPDHGWLVRLWVLVAAFAAVTVARSIQVGVPFRDPGGTFFAARAAGTLAIFVVLLLADAAVRTGRRGWTLRAAAATLRRRWPRRRLALAVSGLLAWHAVYFCYHNLKSWDVFNTPRDAALERLDRWLFLGHSPAVLLHDLLGEHVAAFVLVAVYQTFSRLDAVAFVAAMVLPSRLRDGFVFIAAASWVWILGVASYYLVPSLGPFQVAPADFAGLPHTSVRETQALYLAQRAHLLAHPHAGDAFAQVSAFASLHVAVTALMLLMARYYGLRRTSRALTAWLAATVVATVYLGWHFAVDDVAGLLIAVVSVRLGRWMIYPAPPPERSANGELQAAGRAAT